MGPTGTRPLAVVTGASSGIGRELAARFAEGGFDLVVAAEDERIGPVARSLTDELRLISLNVTGAVHLAKRVLPGMIEAGRGGVLFTSSIAATAPGPYHATYAASKAFLLPFSEALRHELRDTGVTATALMPGPTDTEFFDRAGMQGTELREQTAKGDPAEVAGEGFDALMAGKDHVIAGSMKNKAQAAAGRVLPETAKAKVQAQQTEPGSGQQG